MTIIKQKDESFIVFDQIIKFKKKCVNLLHLFLVAEALGFDPKVIEHGLLEMVRKDHNIAEFGDLKKTFMYTRTIEE